MPEGKNPKKSPVKTVAKSKLEALDILVTEGENKPLAKEEIIKEEIVEEQKTITLKAPIIVSELAEQMELKPFVLMKSLIDLKVFVSSNQAIDPEIAVKICQSHGFVFEKEKREKGTGIQKVKEVVTEPEREKNTAEENLELRAPVITFMGHVDHGKTSLLDFIKNSRVVSKEAGGITQHIGAYQVEYNGMPISFIDTPGHAIFTEMRARGADITDIVVLVVAADDGIMPQTKEAINHAKAAKKTVIVAINKCDLPGADTAKIYAQLMENGLNPVSYGGDVECIEVSAQTGQGMDALQELLTLQAEVLELTANPSAPARAVIIEAKVQTGKGNTATMIIREGTIKQAMPFVCGSSFGKIKKMLSDKGELVKSVAPGIPVEVLGFEDLPDVGDELVEMESEKNAKKLSNERQGNLRSQRLSTQNKSQMEDLMNLVSQDGQKIELKLILKTDVMGSTEAIVSAINEIDSEKINATFIHSAPGAITESDVLLASSSDAIILGFNTKVESNAVKRAKEEGIQIKLYSIVYELIDQVKEAMLGLLEPESREDIIGQAEVKEVFKLSKGTSGGCIVIQGKVNRKAYARVVRDKLPVFDGKMSTLRRFKDEIEEVKEGVECGIRLGNFSEYMVGDIIECYLLEKVDQTL